MVWSIIGGATEIKKDIQYSPQINAHQPFETYAPSFSSQSSYNTSPQYSYGVNINSPNAENVATKKDMLTSDLSARQQPYLYFPQEQSSKPQFSDSAGSGLSNSAIMIAAVAAVAILVLK